MREFSGFPAEAVHQDIPGGIWKEAILVPIPKPSKDPTLPGNYRPISLKSWIFKLLEKIINCHLTLYLEKEQALPQCQFGFRNTRSTTDVLIRLKTNKRNAFTQGRRLLAVFIDLEKAYATASKHIILKLHSIRTPAHLHPKFPERQELLSAGRRPLLRARESAGRSLLGV